MMDGARKSRKLRALVPPHHHPVASGPEPQPRSCGGFFFRSRGMILATIVDGGRGMTLRNPRWGRPPQPEIPPEAIAAADLARQIRKWLAWLQHERRYSPHTLAAYKRDLWAFLRFLQSHFGRLPSLGTLRELGRTDLRAYL